MLERISPQDTEAARTIVNTLPEITGLFVGDAEILRRALIVIIVAIPTSPSARASIRSFQRGA